MMKFVSAVIVAAEVASAASIQQWSQQQPALPDFAQQYKQGGQPQQL